MARSSITYENVVNTIESLMANGEKPTILKIREALGGVGSPNTISKYLRQWKEQALKSNQASVVEQTDQPVESSSQTHNTDDTKQANACDNTSTPPPSSSTKGTPNMEQADRQLSSLNDAVQSLIHNAEDISSDLLSTMSNEWNVILNEKDEQIKIRKLHAALIKEQTRREAAEKVAQESKVYSETIKEQVAQRINELKDSLESEIAFLNTQIRKLKKEAEIDIDYYRNQLEKANQKLIELADDQQNSK